MQPRPLDQHRIPSLDRWRGFVVLFALMTAIAAPLWHLHIINLEMPSSHSDFVAVWVGTRTVLEGRNPYTDQTTREIQMIYYGRLLTDADHVNKMAFAYPPHTAIVLAPLALLSWDQVRTGFPLVVGLLMVASVPLWLRALSIQMKTSQVLIATVLALGSWPMMWGLHQQQATLIVTAFLAGGLYLLHRRSDGAAGFLFALSTIKPQLMGPLLLWLLLWTALQRRWRFGVSCLASTSLLLLCATRLVPKWLPGWRYSMADYLVYTHAYPALQSIFGRWIGAALMIAVAATAGLILWRLRKCEMDSPSFGVAISLALATTVSLNPTYPAMIYNQVLLLPAFLILSRMRTTSYYPGLARRISLVLMGWGFAATILAVLGESIGHPSAIWDLLPFQNALLPVSAVVALMSVTSLQPEFSLSPALSQLQVPPSYSG